ncbi:MAG TPA: PEGA domain-containing protein [Methanocorpusculum sp.]|nr:PEGA domain-containing protein [Methanocorpusculum sp.]
MKKSIIFGILGIALVLGVFSGFAAADTPLGGNYLSVSIDTTPSDAYVKFVGTDGTIIDTGYTPYTFTVSSGTADFGKTGSFIVSKNGYETVTATTLTASEWNKAAQGGYSESHSITLTPIATGTINIASNPSGANVKIDGSYYGTTPFVTSLSPGSHTVTLSKSGYSSYSTSVYVKSNEVSYIDATLSSSSGYISISSNPKGASVYIDGSYVGETDCTVSASTGTHSITITKSGYGSYGSKVTVNSGQVSTVSAILPESSSKGYVDVASSPAGASVYIDGSYVGITPSNGYLDAGAYSTTGSHSIKLILSGYETYSSSFTTSTTSTVVISPTLTPEKSSTGTIHVTSSPVGATVTVDGTYYGTTPISVPNLNAGSHTVKVSAAGYEDNVQTVNVNAGQYVEYPVTLYTPSPAPATPAPILGVLAGLAAAGVVFALRRRE